MFFDNATVCLDGSMARYGSPFSRVVDETDVDRRVCLKIVCLARFGVGVEEKIEAVALLFGVSIVQLSENKRHSPDINTPCVMCLCRAVPSCKQHTFAAKAIALDVSKSLPAVCAVIKQILVLSMNVKRSSTFSLSDGSCLFCAV